MSLVQLRSVQIPFRCLHGALQALPALALVFAGGLPSLLHSFHAEKLCMRVHARRCYTAGACSDRMRCLRRMSRPSPLSTTSRPRTSRCATRACFSPQASRTFTARLCPRANVFSSRNPVTSSLRVGRFTTQHKNRKLWLDMHRRHAQKASNRGRGIQYTACSAPAACHGSMRDLGGMYPELPQSTRVPTMSQLRFDKSGV